MTAGNSQATRRNIRFESLDQLSAELDRIEAADRAGTLQAHGNWTAGQILSHIAAWIEYGWDGFPVQPPPFFIRWILQLMLKKYLRTGLPAGVKIPRVPNGTFGQDEAPVADAVKRLRNDIVRLKNGEVAKFDSPAFGSMSHEDRITFNLRHAELHLSFISYK